MKGLKKRIVPPLLAVSLCLLAGCDGLLDLSPADSGAASGGTGRVLISITGTGAASRTLLPSLGVLDYKLEFTQQGETEPALTKTVSTTTLDQDLEEGNYTLTVTAYKTGTNDAVAGGGTPITIRTGQITDVTVSLALTAGQAGTGTLNYAVTLSGEITLAGGSLTLYPLSYSAAPVYIELNTGPSGVKTIPSGYYRAQFSVYGNTGGVIKIAAKTTVVHVNDFLETRAWYTPVVGDFTDTDLTGDKLYIVENLTQLESAFDSISDTSEAVFTILVNDSFSSPPVSLTTSGYNGKTIILRGNGGIREISLSSQGSLFTIGSSSVEPVLKLRDITLKGISGNNTALLVLARGELIMEAGTVVTGNTSSSYSGGGVHIRGGSFTMRDNASVNGNTSSSYDGGGVYVSSGSFTMRDNASVSENTAGRYGGGVYVKYVSFAMEDGASVSGNTASGSGEVRGGGVYVAEGGAFTMGGSSSVNTNTASSSGSNVSGGGVYIDTGNFTITGNASVSGNTASSYDNSVRGGGVCFLGGSGGTFAMQDNTSISGNKALVTLPWSSAKAWGGGVFLYTTGTTLTKTGGVIYGSNETGKDSNGEDLENTAWSEGAAIALGSSSGLTKYRNTTVGPDQNLSTSSNTNWSD